MRRACDSCGVEYEAKRATSRFCSTRCRVRNHEKGNPAPVTRLTATELPSTESTGPLFAAVRRQLEDADRLDTYIGQAALHLAARIEAPSSDTGSSLAALHKQLDAAMDKALANAAQAADPLDELKAWRDRRRINAG